MLIFHTGHTDTIQVYSVTVMTHAKALQAGHSSQGTSEPITPVIQGNKLGIFDKLFMYNTRKQLRLNLKFDAWPEQAQRMRPC